MNISRRRVEEYYFGNPPCIADKILFIKRPTRLAEYKEHLSEISEFGNVWQGVTGVLQGQQVTIIVTGIGPGMVGDAAYALHRPNSVCLYSGTCGGLHKNLKIGDYFIADQAVCGDGYSFLLGHHPFTEISGDCAVLDSLHQVMVTTASRIFSGTTFTTSSVVRESNPDFWKLVDEKCGAIEMAASAFYAASIATHKRAAAYFWVGDLPTQKKSFFTDLEYEDIRIKQTRYDQAVRFDLEILASL